MNPLSSKLLNEDSGACTDMLHPGISLFNLYRLVLYLILIDLKIQPIPVNLTCQCHYNPEQLIFALLGQFQNFYGS